MSSLLRIRSERDQMSAIERRIADFILDNAHLLRDYSSQQLANALGISQSSVVKFSQKLGFKGYPDLKFSIGEAVARGSAGAEPEARISEPRNPLSLQSERLWQGKQEAEEETRLINSEQAMEQTLAVLAGANRVFCFGMGADAIFAREFAWRLSLLGIATVWESDPMQMSAQLNSAQASDLLLVFSESGTQPELLLLSRQLRGRIGSILTLTRHTANALRALADIALVISAHDDHPAVSALLYRTALQQLLDVLLMQLMERHPAFQQAFARSAEQLQQLSHS